MKKPILAVMLGAALLPGCPAAGNILSTVHLSHLCRYPPYNRRTPS